MAAPLAIITGANSGFGYACACILLKKGLDVLLLCRSVESGDKAVKEFGLEGNKGCGVATVMCIDLSNLTSVVAFVEEYKKAFSGRTCKYLVLNAGIVKMVRAVTPQGLEETNGVNHFGGVALFNLLFTDVLVPSKTRVVAVGSMVHQNATITGQNYANYDLTGISDETFSVVSRYSNSKLLNHLWGFEVQKRFAQSGVTCNSVHPGSGLFTGLGRRDASPTFKALVPVLLGLLAPLLWVFGFSQTWHDGGVAEVAAAESPEGGLYFNRHWKSTASAVATNPDIQRWCYDETCRVLLEKAQAHNLPLDIAGPGAV